MGKCVAWDTLIVDPVTGARCTIEACYQAQLDHPGRTQLLSLGDDHQLRPATVGGWVDDGRKPVFRVRTRLGREVRTTATHPFLTPGGWRPLMDVAVGARIAVTARVPVFGHDPLPSAQVELLAHGLGTGTTSATLTHDCGRSGQDKRVPAAVFRLPRPQVALFLDRLWATDGGPWTTDPAEGDEPLVYRSVSRQLVRDLQHLLLRFGINAGIRPQLRPAHEPRRAVWELEISAAEDLRTFYREIGSYSKDAAGRELLARVTRSRPDGDTITRPALAPHQRLDGTASRWMISGRLSR